MSYEAFPPLPEWFWYPITFMYGAIVGSFLNVLIYRLPLDPPDNRITGKSYCPNCQSLLKGWHNIPLLSFLFLRARCGFCKVPISWRYFMVELLSAAAWMALYHQISERTGISWVNFVAHALFASVLIAMVYIDLDHFIAPDELNWTGIALGVGRDLICLLLAWQGSFYLWQEFSPQFLYFGWLPRSIAGGLAYGSVLFAVSFIGFVYYAREPWESVGQVSRRFFTFEDAVMPEGYVPPEELPVEEEEEGDVPPAPRLRFTPGFVAVLAMLLLFPVVGIWGLLAFAIPFAAFIALSRQAGETTGAVARRFWRADDVPGGNAKDATPNDMQAEADQFALEAETGKHGGMGLGDVKLALAIGAVLGPGYALLSLFFATAFGAVTGIVLARIYGRSLRVGVPFVPFMAAGAIIVMLFGPQIVGWYLNTTGMNQTDASQSAPAAVRRPKAPR